METWQQDRQAINHIENIVLQLGWMWREQPTLDYGIDGQIEICGDDKKPTGQLFAVQAKGGDSYFNRRKADNALMISLRRKHLEYWNNYLLPVLVIGIFHKEDRVYWLYVQDHLSRNPDLLEGESDKVSVKLSDENVFDPDAKSQLHPIPDRHKELIATSTETAKSNVVQQLEKKIADLEQAAQSLPRTHLPVARQILELLSQGRRGAGVSTIVDTPCQQIVDQGTIMLRWRLGNLSPKMILVDYVGEVRSNRLSIILNQESSLTLRAFQKDGTIAEITSNKYKPHESLVILAVWNQHELSLWVNGEQFGPIHLRAGLTNSIIKPPALPVRNYKALPFPACIC